MEAVRATVTRILRILDDPALRDLNGHERRRLLEEIAASRFDCTEMSKRVLGAYWKPLTEIQRNEFVAVYKSFLSDKYPGRIEDYSWHKPEVGCLTEGTKDSYAEVRTELQSDKTTIPMDSRFSMKDGCWSASDIIIDGVSLVSDYRSQFQKIVRESSYDQHVTKLCEQTAIDEPTSRR